MLKMIGLLVVIAFLIWTGILGWSLRVVGSTLHTLGMFL